MKTSTIILIGLITSLLAGCASKREHPQSYDFGIAEPPAATASDSVFVAEVRAAEWLDTTEMLYRIAYRDPRVLASYADSRWAGMPAAMLRVRLRQSVGAGIAARTQQVKCVLSLNVAEFSQVFDSEKASRAVFHAQATLAENIPAGRSVTRDLRLERSAPTADAAGGAAAFSEIVGVLSQELRDWIAESGLCKP